VNQQKSKSQLNRSFSMLKFIDNNQLKVLKWISKVQKNSKLINFKKEIHMKKLFVEEKIIWVIGWNMLIGKKDYKNLEDVDRYMKELFKLTINVFRLGLNTLKWKWNINLLITQEMYGRELLHIYLELINFGINILTWKKS